MQRRKLAGLEVSALGLGCMGLTPFYGNPDPDLAIATIHRAADLGIDLLDTSDAYGQGRNEELVGRAISGRRERYVVATKFGNLRLPDGTPAVNGRPEYVAEACEASLRRLGTEVIDLYFLHRVDPSVAIEDTVGAMGRLVERGLVRHIGLSEAGAATLRRAHATFPIAALQSEYSLSSRDVEDDILDTCRELGVGFVAYSPLGRGLLGGEISKVEALDAKDVRRTLPRFLAENLEHNHVLVDALATLAKSENCTAAQLALAWVLSRGDDVVPIAGTSKPDRLAENAASVELRPSPKTLDALDRIFAAGVMAGARNRPDLLSRMGI
jgi:aryl-alcohol dehydrogenase-like predicted oxidoreductase